MTAAAARIAAVLCALRRAAGERRALRVMLFLGGLLTVGFLYGGQAHAAEPTDRVSVPPVSADAEVDTVRPAEPAPARELRRVATDSVDSVKSLEPRQSVETVQSLEPVQSVQSVRQAAEPVADAARQVVRPVLEPVTPPLAPPLTPPVNGQLPGPLTLPVGGGDEGRTPQLPGDGPTAERPGGGLVNLGGGSDMAVAPFRTAGGYDTAAAGQRTEVRYERPAPVPPQAPGKPCDSMPGALQQSGETHTPRKGDQHAAMSAYARPFALVPGAGWAAGDAPTRERAREILEFPG
ncbi:hypothetical protein [Streptomyces sp. NPDC001820]|uniref:hypothetical protein n=1 Tax=Streptomyces sp. NPDC001820 TaxID=3364613 RepID=UPI0036B3AD27